MRQYAGFATAAESNRRYRYLLERGTTGLSVAFDLPTQIGYDSDDPHALGEVGRVGVAIDSLEDMEVLLDGLPLGKLTLPSSFPNLDLVPAKAELAATSVQLSALEGGERYLSDALAGEATDGYGFVFLDCPPAFGPLTVNALAAADRVLVPVQAEYYALEGLSQLLGSIDLVKRRLNPALGVAGILLTMVDARTRLAGEVEEELRRYFGALVFTTTVPRSIRLAEAPSHGVPAIAYDRRSAGAEAYWKVAMELVERA